MNVANLQLEGLLMAVASLNDLLVGKGVLSAADIDLALRQVEASMTADERLYEDMSPSNRDAVCFPVRLLLAANGARNEAHAPSFSDLTRRVGRMKEPYNDQM
jgi:hypothetical protein